MTRYIAFLRAINVGGHTVKMDQLRNLFAALGFAHVETFIASGNVIFDAEAADTETLERAVASHLQQSLGYPVATFIRTPAEVAAVARYQPFAVADTAEAGPSLYIGFLPAPPGDEAQVKVLGLRSAVDDFHVHGRELYWLSQTGMGRAQVSGATLEKALGMPTTLRNVTTVRKLAAKYAVQ
ncbi:MAG: DUF1697 domain-containing protein [Anaerolineae bacterium]